MEELIGKLIQILEDHPDGLSVQEILPLLNDRYGKKQVNRILYEREGTSWVRLGTQGSRPVWAGMESGQDSDTDPEDPWWLKFQDRITYTKDYSELVKLLDELNNSDRAVPETLMMTLGAKIKTHASHGSSKTIKAPDSGKIKEDIDRDLEDENDEGRRDSYISHLEELEIPLARVRSLALLRNLDENILSKLEDLLLIEKKDDVVLAELTKFLDRLSGDSVTDQFDDRTIELFHQVVGLLLLSWARLEDTARSSSSELHTIKLLRRDWGDQLGRLLRETNSGKWPDSYYRDSRSIEGAFFNPISPSEIELNSNHPMYEILKLFVTTGQ